MVWAEKKQQVSYRCKQKESQRQKSEYSPTRLVVALACVLVRRAARRGRSCVRERDGRVETRGRTPRCGPTKSPALR